MSESVDGRYIPLAVRRKVRHANRAKKCWPKSAADSKLLYRAVSYPTPMLPGGLEFLLKHFDALLPTRYRRPRPKK